MKFAVRLKNLRKERGISQQKLAEVVGISKSAISMYENGTYDLEFQGSNGEKVFIRNVEAEDAKKMSTILMMRM